MSDRIDELVACIKSLLHPGGRAYDCLIELATIARKAEAEVAAKSEVGHKVADAWQNEADNWKARALKAEAEVERLSHLEAAALPLWGHIGCAGCCGNTPHTKCEGEYKRFIDALYQAVIHYNQADHE